ncbi:hypothetical protein L596_011627 [Steinernema carpocapsae]|uniref:Uncharacterized protein n=1 Tax=Steinernema carpocapsae TaxID=34508 RepID=A0A4U5NVF7_STECR|nr:hypothetical protein L596_011627 [Steinernema carpocapsae]
MLMFCGAPRVVGSLLFRSAGTLMIRKFTYGSFGKVATCSNTCQLTRLPNIDPAKSSLSSLSRNGNPSPNKDRHVTYKTPLDEYTNTQSSRSSAP